MIMNKILDKISSCNEIAISYHVSPDGDSIGSALALREALMTLGKKAYIMSKETVPDNLQFLPESSTITGSTFKVLPSTDLVIILDCGDFKRINADLDLENKNYMLANIDHHLSNEFYGDFNYVDAGFSATGEIVYQMLKLMEVSISKSMAACLYTSIITDTGSFRYSSTSQVTHAIAGELINTGMDFSRIHRKVFDDKPFSKVKFVGRAIEKMELIHDKVCVIKLTDKDFLDFNLDPSINTSDIIALGLEVNTAEVAVLFKEAQGFVKVSLRSKSDIDVRKVAEKFGGGGHTKASGLTISNTGLEEAVELVLNEIEKELI